MPDIAPKVHRADMSVLSDVLPPKKEFVITVPLTDLQIKAYSLYVRSMISGAEHSRTKSGQVQQTTLWHWLAILSLLCNHPSCFNAKLNEREEDAEKGVATSGISTPLSLEVTDTEEAIVTDINTPIWKTGVSEELVRDITKLFKEEAFDLDAIDLSFKVKILCQILDASRLAGDKTLVFSQSIPTLNFLEKLCIKQGRKFARLDGQTPIRKRQAHTKAFNNGTLELYLISTGAGGLGLNLPGANRVVIFDFKFNPIMEEQAIGRAYRIGQKKNTFVYRFISGGTFEESVHNKVVFKSQLSARVVDKKTPIAWATKSLGEFLFEPKAVAQKDLSEFRGKQIMRFICSHPFGYSKFSH
jgi:SNF2 family DNA or RNA helicase